MNKNFLTAMIIVAGVLVLTGAGCGKNTTTTGDKLSVANKIEETKSEKVITNKNSQQIVDDLGIALDKVFGEAKLIANQQNFSGKKGYIGLSFSIGRNPSEADVEELNSTLDDVGYKVFRSETEDDPTFGKGTNITYFSSQYFATLSYTATRKNVDVMLIPADEAREMLKEAEQKGSQ